MQSLSEVLIEWRKEELERLITETKEAITVIPLIAQRLNHPGTIPFNSVCSFSGKIVDTNRILVKSGDYLLERTAYSATQMLQQKLEGRPS